MARGVWLAFLALTFALVVACAGQAAPSTTSERPSEQPASAAPRTTANPCWGGLTYMEAFSQRMADDLASFRPLVTARSFDIGAAIAVTRRVSATLTAYNGLDERLRPCEQTADLAQRVEALLATLAKTVARSLSAPTTAAQVQRDASVALFKRLPEVLALSKTAKDIADGLALDLAVAQVPASSLRPIGSLTPLPTPTPRPTPRPTPKPPKVATIAASFFGSGVRVTTYRVTGKTPYDIVASMNKKGPYSRWLGGRAAGLTKTSPSYRFAFSTDMNGRCRIVATKTPAIVLRYTIVLPRWIKPSGTPAFTIQWWNSELRDIATHEKVHVDIYRTATKRANSTLAASTCANAQHNLNLVWAKAQRQNCEFDMNEYGSASGLSLATCLAQ
jgi:predicted secreted Zn-dependent protease